MDIKKQEAKESDDVCKICKIDKDDDKLLLCDQCNEGFHIYCLKPILKTIPKRTWFCKGCKEAQSSKTPANVETIIQTRQSKKDKKKLEYLVKYKNLDHKHNSWVDAGKIAQKTLQKFEALERDRKQRKIAETLGSDDVKKKKKTFLIMIAAFTAIREFSFTLLFIKIWTLSKLFS